MSICPTCGKFKNLEPMCDCYERYEEDMRNQHYPPGLTEEAKEIFNFWDWSFLHRIEFRMHKLKITPEEARAEFAKAIRGINGRPAYLRALKAEEERVSKIKLY